MGSRLIAWSALGALLGGLFGFAFGKADPRAPLFVAGIGMGLGLLGALVTHLSRKTGLDRIAGGVGPSVLIGLLLGIAVGTTLGVRSSFGQLMLALFNPDLAPQDFQAVFGAIGGSLLGGGLGAILGGVLQRACRGCCRELADRESA